MDHFFDEDGYHAIIQIVDRTSKQIEYSKCSKLVCTSHFFRTKFVLCTFCFISEQRSVKKIKIEIE